MKTLISALALLAVSSAFATTVSTPVFGTYKINCPANSDTYIGIPVTRTPEFSGTVQSKNGFSIVANGEPNWTANKFVYEKGVQSNHYYLKFTSGELEGAWYNIQSNDPYSIQIAIGEGELAKVEIGDSFEVIPHWTMPTLFEDGNGFTKSVDFLPAQNCTFVYKPSEFTEDGLDVPVGQNREFLSAYYYRGIGNSKGWKDAEKQDATDEVIEPNAVFRVRQPNASAEVTFSGVIPMCATSFVLFTGEQDGNYPNQDIYVMVPAAVDIQLSELTDSLINSGAFVPSTHPLLSSPVDYIQIFANERIGMNLTSDNTCYYRMTSNVEKWLDGDKIDADSLTLKGGTVLVFSKKSTGTVSEFRCKFKPNYVTK